jgi:magnesium-transporting ATPase (P-type)
MAANPQVMMEISFNVIYLIYICVIVALMSKNMNNVNDKEIRTAKRIRLAFLALLIGDLGHVGARLIAFFSEDVNMNYAILGVGTLLEMIGLTFLFILFTDAWRIHFNRPNNLFFKILIGIGVVGLIIFAFPQNEWLAQSAPYTWLVIRNIPWLIQGVVLSILIFRDARAANDKKLVRIGIYIFVSYFFYMPVIFFGQLVPMLGMLMIIGTIIYMLWEYTSYSRFFKKKK